MKRKQENIKVPVKRKQEKEEPKVKTDVSWWEHARWRQSKEWGAISQNAQWTSININLIILWSFFLHDTKPEYVSHKKKEEQKIQAKKKIMKNDVDINTDKLV